MIATEPRMPAAAASVPSGDNATLMIGTWPLSSSPRSLAVRADKEHAAVGAASDDLAVARDRHRIERRRQRDVVSGPPSSGQMRSVRS